MINKKIFAAAVLVQAGLLSTHTYAAETSSNKKNLDVSCDKGVEPGLHMNLDTQVKLPVI